METKTSYEWYMERLNKKLIIKSPHGWSKDIIISDNWLQYYYNERITYNDFKSRFDKCTMYNSGYDFMALSYDKAILFWNLK